MPGHRVDALTQRWVVLTGRRIDLSEIPWLQGPIGGPSIVADQWVHNQATRLGATVAVDGQAGLLSDVRLLASPDFEPERLSPAVRDFYEHITDWRLGVTVNGLRGRGRSGGSSRQSLAVACSSSPCPYDAAMSRAA